MIPVFEPLIGQEEIDAVVATLRRGEISGTFGRAIPEFEEKFAALCGCKYGVATTSGTTALQLAVRVASVEPGDEILMSASTNIATALAAVHNRAVPVPVDSEERTWNLDIDLLESLVTPRTRVIVPVHLYGHPVDMDELCQFADRHGLLVIEDAAEAHGALCRGRPVGSFGHMACFSFYANKVITTGEGGMVVTNDSDLAERLRLLRNLAFQTPRFYHEQAGYNFRMTGMQAALGLAQLTKIDRIIEGKRRVASAYNERLADLAGIRTPYEEPWAKCVFWMYAILVDPGCGTTRDALAEALRNEGIGTRTCFCPLNLQPCLQELPGFRADACPVAERLWKHGLYLPSSVTLDDDAIATVAQTIERVVTKGA